MKNQNNFCEIWLGVSYSFYTIIEKFDFFLFKKVFILVHFEKYTFEKISSFNWLLNIFLIAIVDKSIQKVLISEALKYSVSMFNLS